MNSPRRYIQRLGVAAMLAFTPSDASAYQTNSDPSEFDKMVSHVSENRVAYSLGILTILGLAGIASTISYRSKPGFELSLYEGGGPKTKRDVLIPPKNPDK